ncbi:hypothetical protein [Inconstantimicrobium mannanitabidum]|uniref:Uncharacterized protein n=1 Tax=Inconstantimicrobium mannanitabidum TaxID=1604901 RepID=A0ACB5REW8_9CLOT|nr:hypothetical protein [Clostridium sp. TW13]GKX67640.1 hypothetical protein rsdtw13_28980 [Clostridium sp. TW13]
MGYKIISGRYETGTLSQQMGYNQLFGEERIQEKFDLYFHWFNIVHEIGHIILDIQKIDMNKVDEELFVNSFAVSYWRSVDTCNNLTKVKCMIEDILKCMPNLIPQEITFKEFFKSIWGTEQMNSVMMYGYFQMSCVSEAFKSNKSLSDLLLEAGYENIDESAFKPYNEEVNSKNANKVLSQCINNLNDVGVKINDVSIELVDNPEIQCCKPV